MVMLWMWFSFVCIFWFLLPFKDHDGDEEDFSCDNGFYVIDELQCDGYDNCGDNSDEDASLCSSEDYKIYLYIYIPIGFIVILKIIIIVLIVMRRQRKQREVCTNFLYTCINVMFRDSNEMKCVAYLWHMPLIILINAKSILGCGDEGIITCWLFKVSICLDLIIIKSTFWYFCRLCWLQHQRKPT